MRREIEQEWAEEEFSAAELGDKRLTARLVQLAGVLGEKPQGSLPDASGEPATLKAAYRFFDNEGVTPEGMLQSHIEATYRRMASLKLVLAVQDTTYLDWTAHADTEGLWPLARLRDREALPRYLRGRGLSLLEIEGALGKLKTPLTLTKRGMMMVVRG